MNNNTSSSKTDSFSQISTNCNEKIPQTVSEANLQKPKFQKKSPENQMKKQKSTLGLLNSKGSSSSECKPRTNVQTLKKNEFGKVYPIFKYHIFYFSRHLEMVYDVFVYLENTVLVKDAINESIKSFNEKFLKEEIAILFKEEENSFDIYLSKKNGCAKKDLPSLDLNQNLSLTHIKTFTLCEKNNEAVTDLRKSSKTSSTDSNSNSEQLPIHETIANRSPSMIIANTSYVNSLINTKHKKDKEEGFFEDCQKQIFCGVWKLFSNNKKKTFKAKLQDDKEICCKS